MSYSWLFYVLVSVVFVNFVDRLAVDMVPHVLLLIIGHTTFLPVLDDLFVAIPIEVTILILKRIFRAIEIIISNQLCIQENHLVSTIINPQDFDDSIRN